MATNTSQKQLEIEKHNLLVSQNTTIQHVTVCDSLILPPATVVMNLRFLLLPCLLLRRRLPWEDLSDLRVVPV